MQKNELTERSLQVLENIKKLPSEGVTGFEWPDYKDERERIKYNTNRYGDVTLTDAMFIAAGIADEKHKKIADRLREKEDCREIMLNDIISLKILDITKKDVIFDNSVYKEDIHSSVNLYQFEKLRHFIPKDPIRCKVIYKSGSKVIVDPFKVMFEEWVNSRLEDGRRGKMPARSQYNIKEDRSIVVKNLHLLKGGYTGSMRIPTISDFVGQDIFVDAFIPGSQIVLNIEKDFSRWEGADVNAFVFNYMRKPGSANDMSIVCSVKEVLKFKGQQSMIDIFAGYTEDSKTWHQTLKRHYTGIVTGVIKSAKKCGVFVEIEGENITGMIEMPASELVNYKPGQQLTVQWDRFDEPVYYNSAVGQYQHMAPYVIENDILKEFNIKPIFKIA